MIKKRIQRSTAFILVFALLLSVTFIERAEALASEYTPENTVLLAESGTWEVPAGVGKIHVVLIGGGSSGQRGSAGSPGGNGGNGSAGSRGLGGPGGSGGSGGNIYEYTASVKAGQTFDVSIGAAGQNTTFGEASSGMGARSSSGYTDPVSGTVYAKSGRAGTAGASGISGTLAETPLYTTFTSASNVSYKIQEHVAYAGRANNKTYTSVRSSTNTANKTIALTFSAPNGTNGSGGWSGASGGTYGSGGNGGDGGNGGNGGAGYNLTVSVGSAVHFVSGGYTDTAHISGITNDTSTGGAGGAGGSGGSGARGCVIIYCSEPQGSVTFDTRGGSSVPKQEGIKVGGQATEPTPPTKTGYEFSGWFADAACTDAYDFSTPVTTDITVYASWAPRSDTPYQIRHYQQNTLGSGYNLFETDELTGTTDSKVEAAPKSYIGFHENAGHSGRLPSGKVAPEGSLVLALYYDRDIHKVTFDTEGGSTVDPQTVLHGAVAVEPMPPTRQGYEFICWCVNPKRTIAYSFGNPINKDITIYGAWEPLTNTPYRVQHYVLNDDGTTYSLMETEELSGTTGEAVAARPKEYGGFYENKEHPERSTSGIIAPDGSTTLKLYYDWDAHTVTFETNGGSSVDAQKVRGDGLAVEPLPPVKQGYELKGWFADQAGTIPYRFDAPVLGDLTIYAGWSPADNTPYKVRHYQQNISGDGYTLVATEELTGTTDTVVYAVAKSYTGFHQVLRHQDGVDSGTVDPGGSLLLTLYYDRDVFSVTFDTDGGSSVAAQTGIRYGATAAEPVAPIKQGYDLVGWFADADRSIAYSFDASITGDSTIYAAWTPRSDTPYKVQHYLQDIAGDGYTLLDIDGLVGSTGTTVSAKAKSYTGFHETVTHPDRVTSGAVAPDGSLSLALYYERDLFSVTFDTNGGSSVATQTGIRYEARASEPAVPTKQGYELSGWYADEALSIAYSVDAPITEDITIYAAWTPRNDTPYRVLHYLQDTAGDGYTLLDTDELTGTTDAVVSATVRGYTGFHEATAHPERLTSGLVAPDGTLTLARYYDRDLFTVTFNTNGGSSVEAQTGIRFEGTASEPIPPTKRGYDLVTWYADESCTIPYGFDALVTDNIILHAAWAPRSDTPYQVKHYLQDMNGDSYTLRDTETLTNTTGAVVFAEAKSYTGFHHVVKHLDSIGSGTVSPDGALVLTLYYDRDLRSVAFDTNGGSDVATQVGIRYGARATEPTAPTRKGYVFSGWYADGALSTEYSFDTPITWDITIYAAWTPRNDTPYTVAHYLQDTTGSSYTLQGTEELTGTTEAVVAAIAKSYTGFHEAKEHPDRVSSGPVAPDGSLKLMLYYDRDLFTVTFDANRGTVTPESQSTIYGAPYGALPVPEYAEHTFDGWYTEKDFGEEVTAETVAQGVAHTLFAHWLLSDEVPTGGTIVDEQGQPIPNVKVTIRAGAVDYKVTHTDAVGRFSVAGVPSNTYNLVAEKDGIIITSVIRVAETAQDNKLVMPTVQTNSILAVGAQSPEIVVGGLDKLYESEEFYSAEERSIVNDGGNMTVTMTITEKAEADVEEAEMIRAAAAGQVIALYLDVTVAKTADTSEGPAEIQELLALPQPLRIIIPLAESIRGKQNYIVYRIHDGEVGAITDTPNEAGEYLAVEGESLTVFANSFSLYSLTYKRPSTSGGGNGGGGDGGGSDSNDRGPQFDDVRPPDWFYEDVMDAVEKGYIESVTKTSFRPNDPITRAQVAYACAKMQGAKLRSAMGAKIFEDVDATTQYATAIIWADSAGVAIGYGDGCFGPKDNITREQLVLVLYRQYGCGKDPAWGKNDFTDTDKVSDWAEVAVRWAVSMGLLKGTDNRELLPQGSVTRAEAAAMFMRTARLRK